MTLDGSDRHAQVTGDLPIAQASRCKPTDFAFPSCESDLVHAGVEKRRVSILAKCGLLLAKKPGCIGRGEMARAGMVGGCLVGGFRGHEVGTAVSEAGRNLVQRRRVTTEGSVGVAQPGWGERTRKLR
jgi:hypothetical protein